MFRQCCPLAFVYLLAGAFVLTLTIGACDSASSGPEGKPVRDAWEAPQVPSAPPALGAEATSEPPDAPGTSGDTADTADAAGAGTSPPSSSANAAGQRPRVPAAEVLMTVNGRPVSRSDFVEKLITAHGLALAEQMILTIAARERLEKMGMNLTDRDVRQAHEDALRRLAMPLEMGPDARLDDQALDTARRLLEEFLVAKNISRLEWELRMEQNAAIRKIAEAEVNELNITEAMLRDEYERAYGPRVQIRHIQLSSKQKVAEVRRRLSAGDDFELLARKFSENQFTAARGGLMPPVSKLDPAVTPLIREAAFDLKEGEVSLPIHEGNWFHILKLERKFPASNIPFANADKQELRESLIDRLVRSRQEMLEAELFQTAQVDIRHTELRRQFERKHRDADRR